VFPLRGLSQDEIIAHKLMLKQTQELLSCGDARPDKAPAPAFEASGGERMSFLKQEHQPSRQGTAPENKKPKTEVRSGYWGWWPWPKP
jgi:hypothetical protein